MAESDSTKNVEKIKFKFCGWCGRLLPATLQYYPKHKDGKKGIIYHSICKKCKYTQKRLWEAKNKERCLQYQRKWADKKRQEYLDSIGETEESLKAKKKKQKSPTQRKDYLNKKAAILKANEVGIFGNKKCKKCREYKPADGFRYQTCGDCRKFLFAKIRSRPVTFKRALALTPYENIRQDPKNKKLGQCRCAYCGRWINPTGSAVDSRMGAINGFCQGENRIYCAGEQCRTACPTYGQQMYPKGFKVNSSREVDPSIRIMCMERDEWTCQKCGANSPDTILHAHHILSYKRNVMLANDIENVITLCKDCHHDVHTKEGCKYHELRC